MLGRVVCHNHLYAFIVLTNSTFLCIEKTRTSSEFQYFDCSINGLSEYSGTYEMKCWSLVFRWPGVCDFFKTALSFLVDNKTEYAITFESLMNDHPDQRPPLFEDGLSWSLSFQSSIPDQGSSLFQDHFSRNLPHRIFMLTKPWPRTSKILRSLWHGF